MAIQIPFDNTGNPITPTFVLATKSGRKLGAIPVSNIHIADRFNSYFDLCFKVYRYNNGTECNLWNDIKDFKLIWCPEWDVWFEIYVEINETNDMIKNVSAKSVGEAELSQINLYDIQINTEEDISQEDYVPTVLYNELKPRGSLLHRILTKAPHYTITEVDSSIANIQRTFTFDDKSIYDALQEIAHEINCIFIIDSGTNYNTGEIKREIRVKDLESHCTNNNCDVYRIDELTSVCPKCGSLVLPGYGENTSIFVSTDNLADDINYSTNIDAVKNCFKLEAGDDLMTATVINCNPNGSAYIWHIPDALKSDMSTELQDALAAYETEYESYQTKSIEIGNISTYNTNIVSKYNALKSLDTFKFDNLNTLSSSVTGYPALMTAYYDTIDAKILLESGLMPSPDISDTEGKTPAQIQAEYILDKIGSLLSGGIAIASGLITQISYINNALKSFLSSFLKSSFGIEISDANYSDNKWTGILKIFDRSGDSSYFINIGNIASDVLNGISSFLSRGSISVISDVGAYRTQALYKTLNYKINDETDIVAIFNKNEANFAIEMTKYSLKRLESFRDACQACLNLIIEQGFDDTSVYGLYASYYTKLNLINNEITIRQSDINIVELVQDKIIAQRNDIQQKLDFQNYITKYSGEGKLWVELASYRRDDTYLNNNYISDGLNNVELFEKAQEFYEVAQKEIFKSATLQHSITATLKNLLAMPEFQGIVNKFKVGNWIRIGINDEVHTLRLLSYEIDFDNLNNIFVEFSDVKKTQGGLSDVESVLNQAASMTTSYGAVAHQASQGQKGNKKLDTWVADGLALTQMKIINNAKNQTIVWDDGGLLCRRYNDCTESYEEEQLKIINSTIAFTNDNWQSVKTAIGKFRYIDTLNNKGVDGYGVNAETIIGELILGQQLMIRNSGSTFTIGHNGLEVSNTWEYDSLKKHAAFAVNPNDYNMISLSTWDDYHNGGGEKKEVFSVKQDGSVYFAGHLDAASGTFKGELDAATGSFSGSITANSGYIGGDSGWAIEANHLYSGNVGLYSGLDYSDGIANPNKGLIRFYAGGDINNLGDSPYKSLPFFVSSTGYLCAKNANITGHIQATSGSFKGTINAANNYFIVDSDGFMTATGAVLKGINDSTFSFSKETIDLGWTPNKEKGNAAVFDKTNVVVSRNIITGAIIKGDEIYVPTSDTLAAGLVHCNRVTDISGGYGFNENIGLKARFGLNTKGEAFIEITPLNDERYENAKATFHFTPGGDIKVVRHKTSGTEVRTFLFNEAILTV